MDKDAKLTAAFEEAMADEAVDPQIAEDEIVDETSEPKPEPEVEVDIEEVIPKDHKERSDLGRKVSALLKKTDKTDEVLMQLAQVIERLAPKEEEDPEDDVYVTKRELKEIAAQPEREATQYQNDFVSTFQALCEKNGFDEDESIEIQEILLTNHNERVMGDGKLDGAINFERAKLDYLNPKKKIVPGKQGRAPGVINKQPTQTRTNTQKPLDKASESFLDFIRRTDGEDAAKKIRKAI